MTHSKRTRKDVEDAYRRGFQAGFNVRPNPIAMILRSIWRKHELKKLKKAWQEEVKLGRADIHSRSIGFVTNLREDEHGISAEIHLEEPNA
jgi:ribosome modulation factor